MPKDASNKFSTRALKEKQPAAPPTNRKKSKSKKGKETVPVVLDESGWVSHVPVGQKINKTRTKTEYRLAPDDLEGLQTETSQTVIRMNGEDRTVDMTLYSERDVERTAWRKHGGPEGWKARLEKLRLTHLKVNRKKPFVTPTDYSAGPSVSIMSLPASSTQSVHPWNATPGLLSMKPRFPPWLWRKCHELLDRTESDDDIFRPRMSSRDREHKIRVALRMLFAYPARPESMLPPSPSVDQLRQVLQDAPSVGAYLRTKGPSKYEGIEEHYHGEDGEYTYSWSSSYLEKLYGALIEIIETHGTGDDGWATARWEVYDKYSECVHGMTYYAGFQGNPEFWCDDAHEWLMGKVDHGAECMSTRTSEYSGTGGLYNSLLPQTAHLRRPLGL